MLLYALDQIQASIQERRKAKEAERIMNKHFKESKMYCKFSSTCSKEYCTNQWAGNCERNKFKMTREEAENQIKDFWNHATSRVQFIKSLEALGLIKFEENMFFGIMGK